MCCAYTGDITSGRIDTRTVPKPRSSGDQAKGDGAPAANPLKIALLKWYAASEAAEFKVGKFPEGVAFDGANIWVSNAGDNTVTKLRAADGSNLGTFAVGNQPMGVAFDGANIWVANSISNTVTKLRASDGTNLGTFSVGTQPWWLAFDGRAVWVTNSMSNSVTKLPAKDGKVLGTFPVSGPRGIAFDGTYVWVSNFNDTVTRLKQDGSTAGTFTVGAQPLGLAFDGANIWVANSNTGNLTKLRASERREPGQFPGERFPD